MVLEVARDDWYRGPSWDPATRERFVQKLSRHGRSARNLLHKGFGLTRAEIDVFGRRPASVLSIQFQAQPTTMLPTPPTSRD